MDYISIFITTHSEIIWAVVISILFTLPASIVSVNMLLKIKKQDEYDRISKRCDHIIERCDQSIARLDEIQKLDICKNGKIIKTGSTRLVFLIGKYAIKIPRCFVKPDNNFNGKLLGFLNGWVANRKEYLWSKSNLYTFLAPVKVSLFGSIIIIMDRAEELNRDEFFNLDINEYCFKHEHKLNSYGKIKNKIYVIDYGN